jgi:hypothetical protein
MASRLTILHVDIAPYNLAPGAFAVRDRGTGLHRRSQATQQSLHLSSGGRAHLAVRSATFSSAASLARVTCARDTAGLEELVGTGKRPP